MTALFDWLPGSEDQLREMVDQGLLSERHTVDFKEQLDQGRGANREHARDLAQFGPDGGVLIVGVNDGGQLIPHPAGWAARAHRSDRPHHP
jgi:hypothetical protein